MNAGSISFVVPREQFLSREFLRWKGSPSVQQFSDASSEPSVFFWARNGLYHALHALQVPRTARALLPAYLCKAAVEPFAAYGLHVDFYRIGRDCKADLRDLAARVQPDTRVVLAAHYFGFPQNIQELRNFCTSRGLLLFEDCAHVLRGNIGSQALGSFGDASVFSYRKFLPMFDGGELFLSGGTGAPVIREREASRFGLAATKHIVGQSLEFARGLMPKLVRSAVEAAKHLMPGSGQAAPSKLQPQSSVDNNSAAFDDSVLEQPITAASRWVLRHSDIPAVMARRRNNFLYLHSLLDTTPGITPLFRSLDEGTCPWVYPLFLDEIPEAHLRLREKGIPAVTWGGVRPHGISRVEFADADFLYDNLVFLPIHQNLTRSQLSLMADVVKTVRAEVQQRAPERIPVAS